MFHVRTGLIVLAVGTFWSVPATAQPLGTFRWQLLPYCNVLTLNIAQQGAVHTLDGTDDRCEGAQAASARGIAFLNPNGTIGFGMTMVQPGGIAVHLEATLVAGSFNGTWRDSSGASGNLVLTPGAGIGGPPRGVSATGVPPGSITSIQLANGAVRAAAIAANSITTGHIADGNVTSADLANGAVGSAAIGANAVASTNIIDGTITTADLLDEPRAASSETTSSYRMGSGIVSVREVTVQAPVPGRVIVNASGWIAMPDSVSVDHAICGISTVTGIVPSPFAAYALERAGADYSVLPFGGTRAFSVSAGPFTVRLNCIGAGGSTSIADPSLTAIFVAGS